MIMQSANNDDTTIHNHHLPVPLPPSSSLPPSPIIGASQFDANDQEDSTIPKTSFSKAFAMFEKGKVATKMSPSSSSRNKTNGTPSSVFLSSDTDDTEKSVTKSRQTQRKSIRGAVVSPLSSSSSCTTERSPLPSSEGSKISRCVPWRWSNTKKVEESLSVKKDQYQNNEVEDDDDNTLPTADLTATTRILTSSIRSTASSIDGSINGSLHSCSVHSNITCSIGGDSLHNSINGSLHTIINDSNHTMITLGRQRRRRTVKFNRRVRIRKISMLKDISPEEIEAKYYSNEEMVNIKKDLKAKLRDLVIKAASNAMNASNDNGHDNEEDEDKDADGSSAAQRKADHTRFYLDSIGLDCIRDMDDVDNDNLFSLRGLEHELPAGKIRRKMNKTLSRDAVFEVQKRWQTLHPHRCDNKVERDNRKLDDGNFVEYPTEQMAVAYRLKSQVALQKAIDVAKRDEIVAKRIHGVDTTNVNGKDAGDVHAIIQKERKQKNMVAKMA